MIRFMQTAKGEIEKDLQEKLDSHVQLAEVSKRAIERERLVLANHEARIAVLRETLRSLKQQQVEKV